MKKTTSDRPKKKRGWARCLNGRVEEENDWVEALIRKGASHMTAKVKRGGCHAKGDEGRPREPKLWDGEIWGPIM